MAKTLYSSIAELSMLLFFVGIGTMMFSPLLYHFEFDGSPGNEFQSIPHVFWFCIVTTTTVGFGDIYPRTAGQFHGFMVYLRLSVFETNETNDIVVLN